MAFVKGQGGRPRGAPNRFTASMKQAFEQVYADLQATSDREHGHLLGWASEHPTEFYKMCARMIPQQTSTEIPMNESVESLTIDQLQAIILDSEETRTLLKVDRNNHPLNDDAIESL